MQNIDMVKNNVDITEMDKETLLYTMKKAAADLNQLDNYASMIKNHHHSISITKNLNILLCTFLAIMIITAVVMIFMLEFQGILILIASVGSIIFLLKFHAKRKTRINKKISAIETDVEMLLPNTHFMLFPADYQSSFALEYMAKLIENRVVSTWKECVEKWEEQIYRWTMEFNTAQAAVYSAEAAAYSKASARAATTAAIFSIAKYLK